MELWIGLVLLAATFAVYGQTGGFDFVNYDDPDSVTNNPHMLDCQFFGVNAGAHHLMNATIHAAAVLLLFAFLLAATGARWPSAFAALIFAVHPLHAESVAWIAERKDVLCAFFWFLTLWAYVRYTRSPRPGSYLLMLAAFCLGLMAKPMMVTLPFVLLLLDVWPLRRKPDLREKIPLFALTAAAAVMTFVVQRSTGAVESLATVPAGMRMENALVSYAVYAAKTFWPSGLAAFYPYPVEIPLWQSALAALVLTGISAAVAANFRERPYLAVGWPWFLGTLVPVIGLVQVGSQARADRYVHPDGGDRDHAGLGRRVPSDGVGADGLLAQ